MRKIKYYKVLTDTWLLSDKEDGSLPIRRVHSNDHLKGIDLGEWVLIYEVNKWHGTGYIRKEYIDEEG